MLKMSKWKIFQIKESQFSSKEAYDEYRESTKCGICHKRIEIGEEFDLRTIQLNEEMKEFNDSKFTSLAVIIHRKCVEK